jgi:hypothetical protein
MPDLIFILPLRSSNAKLCLKVFLCKVFGAINSPGLSASILYYAETHNESRESKNKK